MILSKAVISENPDLVFIFFGANDAMDSSMKQFVPLEQFRHNIRLILLELRAVLFICMFSYIHTYIHTRMAYYYFYIHACVYVCMYVCTYMSFREEECMYAFAIECLRSSVCIIKHFVEASK
jgi:hypothetical protein